MLTLLSGGTASASLPSADAIHAMLQGRRIAIASKDIARMEPGRDATGGVTWPAPGYLMVRLTYSDQSESILPIENIKFPTTGLSGDVLLSGVKSAVRGGMVNGVANLQNDLLILRDSKELEGEILNQLFEVRVIYNASSAESAVLRFTRDQLRRVEFGDLPLETKTEVPAPQLLTAQPGVTPQSGLAAPAGLAPQTNKVPVRPRYDRIFLRNGDRLTGEILGSGLDFKVLPLAGSSPTISNQAPESKLPDANRRLVALSDLKTIDFAAAVP